MDTYAKILEKREENLRKIPYFESNRSYVN